MVCISICSKLSSILLPLSQKQILFGSRPLPLQLYQLRKSTIKQNCSNVLTNDAFTNPEKFSILFFLSFILLWSNNPKITLWCILFKHTIFVQNKYLKVPFLLIFKNIAHEDHAKCRYTKSLKIRNIIEKAKIITK